MISGWGANAARCTRNHRRKSEREKSRARQKKKSEFHYRSPKKHHERREKDYIVELSESMSQNNQDAIKCFRWATLIVNHIIATLNQNEKYETHSSRNAFVDLTNQPCSRILEPPQIIIIHHQQRSVIYDADDAYCQPHHSYLMKNMQHVSQMHLQIQC